MELKAIFYARFHPEKGPTVMEQVPTGSVASRTPVRESEQTRANDGAAEGHAEVSFHSKTKSLFTFSDLSTHIIPPYDLCGKSLSVCVGVYRVLGWPISLESETYARNRFTFNVCFVLGGKKGGVEEDGATASDVGFKTWEQVVRKTALFFRALEAEDGILAAEEEQGVAGSEGKVVKGLLEKIFEQLITYLEACIRVSDTHTLNLRLPPFRPPLRDALKVHAWDVPLLIRPLPSKDQWTWDLVSSRIHPYIDGINHIARIAEKGEVEEKLVRRAVRGLVVEGRVRVVDLFHFQACYALTGDWSWFVRHAAMREECVRYVTASGAGSDIGDAKVESSEARSKEVLALYTALTSSPSVHAFVLSHQSQLQHLSLDTRRFVTFGVLKGFLRRRHKYLLAVPSSTSSTSSTTPSQGKTSDSSGSKIGSGSKRSNEEAAKDFDRAWRKAALSSGWATPLTQVSFDSSSASLNSGNEEPLKASSEKAGAAGGVEGREEKEVSPEEEKLRGFLNGKHCLDETCVAMRMSETKVMEKVRSVEGKRVWGEVVVVCK